MSVFLLRRIFQRKQLHLKVVVFLAGVPVAGGGQKMRPSPFVDQKPFRDLFRHLLRVWNVLMAHRVDVRPSRRNIRRHRRRVHQQGPVTPTNV